MKKEYIHDFEIKVFEDTRRLSGTDFNKQTKELVNKNTKVYKTPIKDRHFVVRLGMDIDFISGGTVSTGYQLQRESGKKVAILNFADALEPGGLVKFGGITQEENICRCSNLYESLLNKKCLKDYYKYNSKLVEFTGTHKYSDRVIYSKDVLVFKDDINYNLVEPTKLDVITCPAPSYKMHPDIAYYVMRTRTDEIVKSAVANNVDILVLGAWGCGAFGQDPKVVGRCFAESIKNYPCFDKVVFAVRPCLGTDGGNYTDLKNSFEEYYG